MSHCSYELANSGKADFEWTYNRLDPRGYFQALGALDYVIPERAAPIFLKTFDAFSTARRRSRLTILDLGCSYGVNATVLKYHRTMEELCEHYSHFEKNNVDSHDLLRVDQTNFFGGKPKRDFSIVGLDRAQFAACYGFWAGLLDDAIPEDFERHDPSPQAASTISRNDLVISTGVVGYVTERTFTRILGCQPREEMPWVASFVLRMFDYEPIIASLSEFGYVTEKLAARYFRQRRFASMEERRHVERVLTKRGLSSAGLESNGHYLAEFFLARPAVEAKTWPLDSILLEQE